MGLTTSELALWYVSMVLELMVWALALRRRLYHQLPVFTGYITVVLVRGLLTYWVYHRFGYTARPAFYFFWTTQALLLTWRGAAIGELAWTASRPYPGLRIVMKWFVAAISLTFPILGVWLAIRTPSRLPPFVLALERDLELIAAIVLLALLSLAAYYQVMLNRAQKLIALGLFLYSLTQVVNNAVSTQWLRSYFHWWALVRVASFHVALVIWLIALSKPLVEEPIPEGPADLQPVRKFMRQGTEAMHELSARLSRFRKKPPP